MKIKTPQGSHLPQLKLLWQQAFHESMDNFLNTAFSFDRCLLAEKEGQVAAALYWFDLDYLGQRLAYLYAIATEESCQHQGIGKALTQAAHDHLKALGYAGTILVPATENLFSFYRGCGYEIEIPGFLRQATDFVGQKVSWQQYASARKNLLPAGAPVASKEVYQYLAAYCDFYVGDNTCLCVSRDGTCQEILPHTPTNTPFALFYPLKENLPTPTYFALPMD